MIILVLTWMSFQDIKKMEISYITQIILFIICIINFNSLSAFILLFFIFLIIDTIQKDKMGGADYKVFLMLSLVYEFDVLYVMLIASICAMPFTIWKKQIPFIPFITIGVICLNLVK